MKSLCIKSTVQAIKKKTMFQLISNMEGSINSNNQPLTRYRYGTYEMPVTYEEDENDINAFQQDTND